MRQGFLGVANLEGRGGGIRAQRIAGAADARNGCNGSNAVDGQIFDPHTFNLNVLIHNAAIRLQKRKSPLRQDRRGLLVFLQP
jgi:hypothetical protein